MSECQCLSAAFETHRLTVLNGYLAHPRHYNPALAYAMLHRLSPAMQPGSMPDEVVPFEDCYKIGSDDVSRIIKYVDEQWLAKDLGSVAFYTLEERGFDRVKLIRVLEYARITGMFDDELWAAVESNAPTEAKPLAAEFPADDIYIDAR